MDVERKKEMSIDYGLEHLWLLTSAMYSVHGGELKTPRYIELAHPEQKFTDNRTTAQIIQDLLDGLDRIS